MKTRISAFLLSLLLLACALPAALAEDAVPTLSFAADALACNSGAGIELTLVASAAPAADLALTVLDSNGAKYPVVFPAGQTQLALPVYLPASGSQYKTTYTLAVGEGYRLAASNACEVTARAVTAYSFAASVYQTYVDREFTLKVRIANPELLPEGTTVSLVDDTGATLETISHNPRRTNSYQFTFKTDASWRPGKTLSLQVAGREQPDASTLVAVGISGNKSIYGVRRDDNKIAFTMDCGSGGDNLPYILDVLDQFGLKITFFVTGRFVEANPDLVREMAARGHEIGNHSYSHPSFYDLTPEEMLSQLSRTSDLVEALTGKPTTLFRPPEGDCNSKIRAIVNAAGYEVIRWTHESYDARKEASQERSLRYSTKDMKGGSIILTHIDADCTVAVLPDILQWYADNGFEVVPVGELLLKGNTATDENGLQYIVEP